MSRSQSHSRKGVAKGFARTFQAVRSISEILLIQDMEYEKGFVIVIMSELDDTEVPDDLIIVSVHRLGVHRCGLEIFLIGYRNLSLIFGSVIYF